MRHQIPWINTCVALALSRVAWSRARAGVLLFRGDLPFFAETVWLPVTVAVAVAVSGVGGVLWMVRSRHRRLAETARRAHEQCATLVELARQRAAEELRASEERFRLVVETAPNG